MANYVTLASEKHKLVHFTTYATIEPPRPKKKGIFYVHSACGKKFRRGEYKTLGDRSKRRFCTCIKCARWALPKE
jgi:hypothetical protein